MKHPENAVGSTRVCPITKKLFHTAWTDHSLPDCYNKCEQCFPDEYISMGERLAELNRLRNE